MADEVKSSVSGQKEIPPWADGEALRHVEQDVLIPKIVRTISRERCKEYLDAFTDCCKGRTISMVWKCRKENRAMQDCLTKYYKDETIFAEAKERYLKERYVYQHNYNTSGDTKDFKKKESATF